MKLQNKDFFSILLVNFLLIAVVFILADFLCLFLIKAEKKEDLAFLPTLKKYFYTTLNRNKPVSLKEKYILNKNSYRRPLNLDSKKDSVIFFGDSFPYGYKLKEEETVSYLIAKFTKRPVYNRALTGTNPSYMLYQLKNESFYSSLKKPKIVFYVYIPVHIPRLLVKSFDSRTDLFYKIDKSDNLVMRNYPMCFNNFLFSYVSSKFFHNKFFRKFYYKSVKKLFVRIVLKSQELIKTHWGDDVEFVVLKLKRTWLDEERQIFDELTEHGVKVFELHGHANLNDKKYLLPDKHPNALYWQKVTPVLIENFNL